MKVMSQNFIEEFLMSQVVKQEALMRLLVEKGIFSKEEVQEMVKTVDREMSREGDIADSGRMT